MSAYVARPAQASAVTISTIGYRAEIGDSQAAKLDGYANLIRRMETEAAVAKESALRHSEEV